VKTKTETFIPHGDAVLLRRFESASASPGGILIPDRSQAASPRATVVAVGPGRVLESGQRREMPVVEGDIVVFAGQFHPVKVEGEDLLVIDCDNILGVVR
jgi:chaperonin GroES